MQIYGRKDKFFKTKPLPESVEAFFVFNDKKLNLKKYVYTYHKDLIFEDNEYSVLTHNLKYLPNNVLQLLPMRLRNFGKFFIGKDINIGALGNKANSMNLMKFGLKSQRTTVPASCLSFVSSSPLNGTCHQSFQVCNDFSFNRLTSSIFLFILVALEQL